MAKEYRHYRTIAEQLGKQDVDADTRQAILADMDYLSDGSSLRSKANWACELMRRLRAERLSDGAAPSDTLGA